MSARSGSVDGFTLAYDDYRPPGAPDTAPVVVCLHGWPGERGDYRQVVPLLADRARLIVPDLRGFGGSDKLDVPPAVGYSAAAQVRSILALLDELGVQKATFVGYDIGSRLVQLILDRFTGRVRGAVVTPPLPGAAERMLAPTVQREFWYQVLHRLPLADTLIDGDAPAVRAYLEHFWTHWSGPGFVLPAADLDRLVRLYSEPGAFRASIGWYRSRPGSAAGAAAESGPPARERVQVPVEVVWPGQDPLFPLEWADRLGEWYADVNVTVASGAGHFVPLESPKTVVGAVQRLLHRE